MYGGKRTELIGVDSFDTLKYSGSYYGYLKTNLNQCRKLNLFRINEVGTQRYSKWLKTASGERGSAKI